MKLKTGLLILLLWLLPNCASFNSDSPNNCSAVDLRIIDSGFWVDTAHYGNASTKSILIMPPTGGSNYIDRSYAKMFCRAGYDTYILKEWAGQYEQNTELSIHQRFYERSQKAIALVLMQIKTANSIGLLGTSVGALYGAVAASYQDRLDAIFIITGGASITSIIVNSDQEAMVDLAKKRRERYNFTSREEYLKALSAEFKLEPMKLGDGFKKKKLGMVVALADTTVPTEMQKALMDYWNPQLVIEKDNAHFWAIVNTWLFDADKILAFFENSLNK